MALADIRRLLPLWILFTTSLSSANSLSAKLDSLSGTVEIQRAGQQTWVAGARGALLFNNDLVRVGPKSSARLTWPDKSRIFVRENSQILVNLHQNSRSGILSRHTTLFFGAALYIIEASLPSADRRTDTKVFTPTAVIGVRGTVFGVEVRKSDGQTLLSVLEGTVTIKNILRELSVFVTSGQQSIVRVGNDPTRPEPISKELLNGLGSFVPVAIIDSYLLEKDRELKHSESADLRRGIIVLPLSNQSRYPGPRMVGSNLAQQLVSDVQLLDTTLKIRFVGEQESDPLTIGIREHARYVVAGDLLSFEISQQARITARADAYLEYTLASAEARLSVIDVNERRQLFERTYQSETSDSLPNAFRKEMKHLNAESSDSLPMGSLTGKALREISRNASTDILRVVR